MPPSLSSGCRFLPIAHLVLNEFHPETPTGVSSFSTYPSHAFLSSKEQLCELNECIILFDKEITSYTHPHKIH